MKKQRLRIIGGSWRGRMLDIANEHGLRPTGDRVRETLFNWLQYHLAGSCCLDLFAGSGALGFEAASRGAAEVHMIEQSPAACRILQSQQQLLLPATPEPTCEMRVHCADALEVLRKGPASGRDGSADAAFSPPAADIVFVDPPFDLKLQAQVLQELESSGWLKPEALVYVEMERGDLASVLPSGWDIHRQKTAGQVTFGLVFTEDGAASR